jgi:hypothetical protein
VCVRTSAINSVPQGRLRVTQDAVLGRICKDEPVPLGTAENTQDGRPGCTSSLPKSPATRIPPTQDSVLATFSRPCGTGLAGNLHPGLRPGLLSAVPSGLNSTQAVLMQTLKPSPAASYVTISITVESVIIMSTVSPTFRSSRFVTFLLILMVFFLPSGSSNVTR